MPRLVAFSDTHGHLPVVPDAKYLVFTGDYQAGRMEYDDAKAEARRFLRWLGGLPHLHKLLVPGNHDDLFWYQPLEFIEFAYSLGIQVMSTVPHGGTGWFRQQVGQLIFLGSQYGYPHKRELTPVNNPLPEPRLYDVLLTHNPPYGIFDFEPRKMENCGSRFLREQLEEKKPGLHLFGHIHDQYGKTGRFANVALCDNQGKLKHEPMIIDVTHLERK